MVILIELSLTSHLITSVQLLLLVTNVGADGDGE